MCYHTHSSPNESIDFAVLWCTQSIDSFGKNGDIFSICTIYIFQTFFGTFPMTFLQKFSNQKVQFSIKINNIPKKPFEKSVRNILIHLISLSFDNLRLTVCSLPGSLSKTRPLSQPKQRLQSSCRDFSFVNCCYVSQTTHIRIGLSARLTCPPSHRHHYHHRLLPPKKSTLVDCSSCVL